MERDDGYKGIVLELSKEDVDKYRKDYWKIRPTHWRKKEGERD